MSNLLATVDELFQGLAEPFEAVREIHLDSVAHFGQFVFLIRTWHVLIKDSHKSSQLVESKVHGCMQVSDTLSEGETILVSGK